jgi:nucleoside-diphosphate-sugar epimerase
MRVFVTGATGFVGTEVVHELINSGHQVLGLARSKEAAATLASIGADAHIGSIENLDSLRSGARTSDAVIHLGFNPDFSKFRESSEIDRQAIKAIGSVIAGSGKPFIVPNGIAGLVPPGQVVTEKDDVPVNYGFPRFSEQAALHLVSQGVHASVIRLPQVHNTVKQGLVTRLIQVARAKGVSAYVNGGLNRWPAAHVSDVARLFKRVLEAGEAGAKYHAVAEEGVEMNVIADAISRVLGVPTKSLSEEEAQTHFGPLSMFVGVDMPASAEETRKKMGWTPYGPKLVTDLERIDQRRL